MTGLAKHCSPSLRAEGERLEDGKSKGEKRVERQREEEVEGIRSETTCTN